MKYSAKEAWSDFPALDLVRTSRTVRLAGRLTLWSLILAVVAMVFLPWRQTATGSGTVLALDPQERPQPVRSAVKGIVKSVKEGLREGSWVEKGDIVLTLEPTAADGVNQAEIQVAAAKAKKDMADARIELASQNVTLQLESGNLLVDSMQQKLEAVNRKWEQAQKEAAAQEADLIDKRNKRLIAEDVFPQGLISREELVEKQQAELAQVEKLAKAKKAADEAHSNLLAQQKENESKMGEIKIKNRNAESKLKEEESKLETVKKELADAENKLGVLKRLKVEAPRSGFIQQWNGLEGSDTVKEGEQLFVIVPKATELAVELTISGNDRPLVHVGDRVRLQFQGWPAVQFVGWPSVAIGTFGGKVNRLLPTDDGKGNFRVLVTADNHFAREDGWPNDTYLLQGMRANGWVLLRRVALGYEIWRQLNGFPPALTEDMSKKEKVSKVKLPK